MKKLKILMFSRGRADRVLTKSILNEDDYTLIVSAREADEYREHNPNTEILTEPKGVDNITKSRQWTLEHFADTPIFHIDDDITGITKNWVEAGEKTKMNDPEFTKEIIRENMLLAKKLGCYLFGFGKSRTPAEFNEFRPIVFKGYLNNSHLGFLPGHDLKYHLGMIEGEDYYISCMAKYTHRYYVLDNRYTFLTKDNFIRDQGCNTYRTNQSMIDNTRLMQKLFGADVVKFKEPTNLKHKVNRGERSLSFPY